MKIDILTLFPDSFAPFKESIIARGVKKGAIEINVINIRDFSKDKHHKCDDQPFGGGAGMLMSVEPVYEAILSVKTNESKIIFPSPGGKVFCADKAKELARYSHLICVCGHYEGIDQRIFELFDIEEISIGDYVLTGGEIPTMAIVDAVSRFVPGVLKEGSLKEESFSNGLLEYPQYTRPQDFRGLKVPQVLISGNHQEIEKWRKAQSLEKTKKVRPDLLNQKK